MIIGEDEFWTDYKPVPTSEGSTVWDYEDLAKYEMDVAENTSRVWTLVEDEEGTNAIFAAAGWHYANRIGYCVTEKPWADEEDIAYYSEATPEDYD